MRGWGILKYQLVAQIHDQKVEGVAGANNVQSIVDVAAAGCRCSFLQLAVNGAILVLRV